MEHLQDRQDPGFLDPHALRDGRLDSGRLSRRALQVSCVVLTFAQVR